MSGGLIVYLVCLVLVMLIACVGFAWWLRELSKRPPGPIEIELVNAAWHVMRWWQTRRPWRASMPAHALGLHSPSMLAIGECWCQRHARKG